MLYTRRHTLRIRDGWHDSLLARLLEPFIALGVDSFLLDCGGFPNLTRLELLVHEVLPIIAKKPS